MDDQTVATAPDVPRLELDPTVPPRRRRRRPRRAAARPLSELRVVALTNMVPPYKVAELERLAAEVGELQVWISTAMEADRRWEPDWGTLDVVPQRNLSVSLHRRHPGGYRELQVIHIPWDTLPRLWRIRPDVVISSELGARTLQVALYCALTSTPLVVGCGVTEAIEHGRGPLRRMLRRVLVPRADAMTVPGSSGARYLQRLGAAPDRLLFLPYSSFHPDRALPERPRAGDLRLLYIGQLIDRKGVLPFMQAIARWGRRHPGRSVELHLVGEGPVSARVDQIELPGNVRLRRSGHVPYRQVPEMYEHADISVLPSLGDEWGNAVSESLALGVPVLGSVYSQAVEMIVREGVNGWSFRPDDPASIDAALDRALAAGRPRLAQMRAAARASVRFLTPEFTAGQILAAVRLATRA